jgi:hypothetical protein
VTGRAQTVDSVEVGQRDEMSALAREFSLPLCTARKDGKNCTRAAGHNESKPGHPGTRHVAATSSGSAMAVWS